jgi:hypothetical protein
MKVEVKKIVCDWGVVINDEVSSNLIFNSKANAEEVKRIIELDNQNLTVKAQGSPIPMSKSDADLIKELKEMPSMGVAVVDYGNKAKAMLSNETNFVEAFLNPELIVIVSDDDF